MVILIFFAAGIGISLGVLNVFFRDVAQFLSIFLQFWFWLTPIVYVKNILPNWAQFWIVFNPLEPLISAFQQVIALQVWPNWSALIYPLSMALVVCIVAGVLFYRHAGDMMDEL